MNIKQVSVKSAALLGALIIPAISFAATYEYVDTSGNLRTVNADNAQVATGAAVNIDPHSGVLLQTTATTQTNTNTNTNTNVIIQQAAPSTDTKAAGIRVLLNALNREHANLASETLRGVYDQAPSVTALAGSLDDNSKALAQSITDVYGQAAGDQFLQIWRSHITYFVAYSTAARKGDTVEMQKQVDNLADYVNKISDFLSGANPNLPRDAVHQLVATHVGLLKSTIDNHFKGDYVASHSQQRATDAQIGTGVADAVAGAIVKQFPQRF
jgi:hypothetical protein